MRHSCPLMGQQCPIGGAGGAAVTCPRAADRNEARVHPAPRRHSARTGSPPSLGEPLAGSGPTAVSHRHRSSTACAGVSRREPGTGQHLPGASIAYSPIFVLDTDLRAGLTRFTERAIRSARTAVPARRRSPDRAPRRPLRARRAWRRAPSSTGPAGARPPLVEPKTERTRARPRNQPLAVWSWRRPASRRAAERRLGQARLRAASA